MSLHKIMIIEDEPEIRLILTELLHQFRDYEVFPVSCGEAGLEVIKQHIIDLALMDIGLKGDLDGIQTARLISEKQDIPVIYITGDNDLQTIERAKLTSPYGYLIKPIDAKQLQALVEIVLEKSRYERQIRKQRQLFATTLNSIQDGVITTDKKNNIVYFNKSAGIIMGLSDTEVVGKNFDTILADLKIHRIERITDTTEEGSATSEHFRSINSNDTFPIITKNQKERSVEMSTSQVIDERGNLTGNVYVFRDISERKDAENKLRSYQKKLRSLSSVLSVMEDTQWRDFALQLHETIGQKLAVGKLKLADATKLDTITELKLALDDVSALIEESIHDIRLIATGISPPALYEIGLEAGLHSLVEQVQNEYDVRIQLENDGMYFTLPLDARIMLFHSIRELVYNALQHAGASQITIIISTDNEHANIVVSDNGRGFDVDAVMANLESNDWFGIFYTREKVEYLQGKLTFESNIGEGTKGIITLPLPENY